jgi:uncharacterized protein YraI
MMLMSKKSLIILLVLILVSGCLQREVKIDKNNGLTINEFSVDPESVISGEEFIVYLEAENVGSTTARNVRADVYGASWTGDLTKWGTVTLYPPDIEFNTPGDFKSAEWILKAPYVPEGVEQPYELTGRVTYTYQTSGVVNLKVFSYDEYRRRLQKGEEIPTGISVTNTYAPVKIDMVGDHPLIVYETGDQQFDFRLYFRNVGDGVPITDGVDGRILGTIEIEGQGAMFSDCMGHSGKSFVLGPDDIKLRRGSEAKKQCTIQVSSWGSKPEGTVTIKFELLYQYYIEKSAVVNVRYCDPKSGRCGGSPPTTTPTTVATTVQTTTVNCDPDTLPVCSAPSSGTTLRVRASAGLRLRENPGLGCTIITTMPYGTDVTSLGECRTNDGYDWYKIDNNGQIGWAASSWLESRGTTTTVSGCTAPDSGTQLTVTGTNGDGLRLRECAGLSCTIITVMPEGATVTSQGQCSQADGYDWYEVDYNGQTGWAASDWLR